MYSNSTHLIRKLLPEINTEQNNLPGVKHTTCNQFKQRGTVLESHVFKDVT